MSGITADGIGRYLAQLEAHAEAAVRKLEAALAAAQTEDDKRALRNRIQQTWDELKRKKAAAGESLF